MKSKMIKGNKKFTVVVYSVFFALGLFSLSGCSTTAHQVSDGVTDKGGQNKSWKARQGKLSKLSAWQLKGRASVAYNNDNWPFGLEWKQLSVSHYNMLIKHPLTRNTLAEIVKSGNIVTLNSNGRVYRDSSAERLIEKNLRVKLPVKGMSHWVRGIASPHYPLTAVKLDSKGRPALLQQAGWNIHYLSYQNNQFDALPTLIKVVRTSPQPVQIKMRIQHWN